MKLINKIIHYYNKFDIHRDRERVEWTNTWIEDCSDKEKKHILLIGDSVTREFRGPISRMLNKSIDFIGSSSVFEDPCFYNIINCFFKKNIYKYSHIIINIGQKHGWYLQTCKNKKDKKRYEKSFEKFIKYMRKFCPNISILLTPPNVLDENLTKLNQSQCEEILSRSTIQTTIAKKYNYAIVDLYDFVLCDMQSFQYRDHSHFKSSESNEKIARYIIQTLKL